MSTIPGCDSQVPDEFTNLCDLNLLWGVIVTALAAFGIIITLSFTVIFSANLKRYMRYEKHRYSTLLYILVVGVFLLLTMSLLFIVKPTVVVCYLRRVGIGIAWTMTLAPLVVGITRTWRMSYLDEMRCGWLALAVAALVCVETIIITEWCILTPVHVTNVNLSNSNVTIARCEKNEYDIALSLIFNALLLLFFVISCIVSLCKPEHNVTMNKHFSSYSVSSLVTSVILTLITVAWAVMVGYGNAVLNHKYEWSDPATGMFMVVSGISVIFIIFCPIFATMWQIRHNEDDDAIFGSGRRSPSHRMYSSHSSLPNKGSSYATSVERIHSFRSSIGDNTMAMTNLRHYPVPAKRNGVGNHVDRVRSPPGGQLNPTLELNEEDIWRNKTLGV